MQFHFFKQQTWKTAIKFCSKNYALPSQRNEFSCATITISNLAGWDKRVGRSPLYTWILEMYHIRGQNSHYRTYREKRNRIIKFSGAPYMVLVVGRISTLTSLSYKKKGTVAKSASSLACKSVQRERVCSPKLLFRTILKHCHQWIQVN